MFMSTGYKGLDVGADLNLKSLGYIELISGKIEDLYERFKEHPKESAGIAISAVTYIAIHVFPVPEPFREFVREASTIGSGFCIGRISA